MERFKGAYEVYSCGIPLCLFREDFVSTKSSIKDCILQAIPGFRFADQIEEWVRNHIRHSVAAREAIDSHQLNELEAEAIVWWSADVQALGGNTEMSPYYIYNAALRARNQELMNRWSDFSFFFLNALKKLPPVTATTYRGESKRVTELSRQYLKGNQVDTSTCQWLPIVVFNSGTSYSIFLGMLDCIYSHYNR
jgi:hypothetical protein